MNRVWSILTLIALLSAGAPASAAILKGSYALDLGDSVYLATLTWNSDPNDVGVVATIGTQASYSTPFGSDTTGWNDRNLLRGYYTTVGWGGYFTRSRGLYWISGTHKALFWSGGSEYTGSHADRTVL